MYYIECDGFLYSIKKQENEPDNIYYKRCWYIANNSPTNNIDFTKTNMLSNIYTNIIYLKCKYNDEIQQQAKSIADKMYSSL